MKVNSIDKRDISFGGFYNSNALKKALAFAEKNGALFASTTSLALSATVRPISILSTPKTDKENKKFACAKAIMSTLLDFVITLAISYPIVKAVGAINKNPQKYLNKSTINNLRENADNLLDSKAYTLANQMFKLGVGICIAAPKALLNILGIPYIMNGFFEPKQQENTQPIKNLTFKSNKENKLAKLIGKIIDSEFVQDFSKKHKNSNFPMHINAIKDTIATTTFITGVSKSNKIKENRKGPLMYNAAISTGLCIGASYAVDTITDKPAQKFIKHLTKANKNDPNLKKYIDGFKIAKPVLIMGTIYYLLIPFVSTFFAERIDRKLPINKQPKS